MIQDLLSALASRLESGPLLMGKEALCRLQINELEMTIEWLEEQETAMVYISVGFFSIQHNPQILADLMTANLFHQGTCDNAVFGLDKEQEEVLLYQSFFLPITSSETFVSACIAMIELAKDWRKKCYGAYRKRPQPLSYVPSTMHNLL